MRKNTCLISVLVLMLFVSGCASKVTPSTRTIQALYPSYADEQMVEQSTAIVRAKVVKKGDLYREDRVTFTEFTISILHSFKGELTGEITLTYDGSDTETYEGNPLPTVGKEYIFFLHRVPENDRLVLLNGPGSRFDERNGKFVPLKSGKSELTADEIMKRFALKN